MSTSNIQSNKKGTAESQLLFSHGEANSSTDGQKSEKKISIFLTCIWIFIWIVGSIVPFWVWCEVGAMIRGGIDGDYVFLIVGICFYVLVPLVWLLRTMSKAKAMLCLARNIAVLYLLAVLVSYTGAFDYAIARCTIQGYSILLRLGPVLM